MLEFTLQLPENNSSAKALLDYIKSLEFATITKTTDWYDELTQEQKEAIERGLADADAGRVFSNEEVQKEVRALIESKRPE